MLLVKIMYICVYLLNGCVMVTVLCTQQWDYIRGSSDVTWYASVWTTTESWHPHLTICWCQATWSPYGQLTQCCIHAHNAFVNATIMDAVASSSHVGIPPSPVGRPLWSHWLQFGFISHRPLVDAICQSTLRRRFGYGLCKRYFRPVLFFSISQRRVCSIGLRCQHFRTSC